MHKYLSILMMLFGASIPLLVVAGVEHMDASVQVAEQVHVADSYTARSDEALPVFYAHAIVVRSDDEHVDSQRDVSADADWVARGACHRDQHNNTEVIAEAFKQAWSELELT